MEGRTEESAGYTDEDRITSAIQDPGKHVSPQFIRAENMTCARRYGSRGEVRLIRTIGRKDRSEYTHQQNDKHDDHANHCEFIP